MMATSDLQENTAPHFCSPELRASCTAGSNRAQRILLRESLHSILGFSQLLAENNAVSNELCRRWAQHIHSAGVALLRLLSQGQGNRTKIVEWRQVA
jgi:hypothetical protein